MKKYIDDGGEPVMDIETDAVNQRGENVMPGRGTVVLPSRERNSSPLEKRLAR